MSYIEDRSKAFRSAADALDVAEEALRLAHSYGLPKPLDRRVNRILKALGPVPGWRLKRQSDHVPGMKATP